jgi:sensor c-di-GMP phosphodiesterase-like protein
MALGQLRIIRYSLVALSVGGFVGAAQIVIDTLIDSQNRKQLRELSNLIVHRAEISVDYAFLTLGELVEKGVAGCDAAGLGELRRQVYRRSTVKDIRIVDQTGHVVCSAYPETMEFDTVGLVPAEMFAARNSQVLLFHLDQISGAALGVLWQVLPDFSLVAVLNNDALLFDPLPNELRDNSEIWLKLENGAPFATYKPDAEAEAIKSPVSFTALSDRYPLVSEIRVDDTTLRNWNKEPRPVSLTAAGLLGLAFGVLLTRALDRAKSPAMELDAALARRQFVPYLQPLFSLRTGEIVGCEILARWIRSDGTIVPPSRFVPLVEQEGRIAALTWQVVSRALIELRPLLNKDKTFKVSFNVSPTHLMSEEFVDDLRKYVFEAGVAARQVVVELTEQEELPDLAQAAAVIAKLRDYGFKVAMDDVGTGHSGLSYIKSLGVNTMKIDKLFVDTIERDHAANVVVEMLVRVARELGMTTVAEGIENRRQFEALCKCGVDEGQGF